MLIWGMSTWLGSTGAASQSSSSGTVPDAPAAAAFDFSPAPATGRASVRHAR